MFSNCFQTVRPQTVIEPVTKARATWEDAVYPRPVSRWISQVPREYELVAPRDLGCWGGHMQMFAQYACKGARGLTAHELAHESQGAQ